MHRKRFIKNTVFLVGTSGVTHLVALVVLPLFVENLGASMYGLFIISNILVGYLGLLDFGFTDGLMRQIGRAHASGRKQELTEVVWTGFWILFAVGVVAALIIYFGRFWIIEFLKVDEADKTIALKLMSVTALFSLLQWPMRLPETILNAVLRIKEYSIVNAIVGIFSSLIMLVLVLRSMDIISIRIGVCCVMGIGWIPMLWLVKRHVPELSWQIFGFCFAAASRILRFSLGMFYTRLLSMLSRRIDYMIIGGMLGVASITTYVIVTKYYDVIKVITVKLFGALLPTVFSLDSQEDRHRLQTVLDEGVRYRALLVSPLAYLGIVISPSFIEKWVGINYVEFALWSQLFLVVVLLNVFGVGVAIARGTGRLMACNSLLTIRVLLNLILSLLFIPRFGVGGPILGTIIASLVLGDGVALPFMSRICGLQAGKAFKQGFLIIVVNLPAVLLLTYLFEQIQFDSWVSLFTISVAILVLFYGTLFLLFFRQNEKRDLYVVLDTVGVTRVRFLDQLFKRAMSL